MPPRFAIFLALIALLAGGARSAQAGDETPDCPPECTPAVAVHATVGQIASGQKQWNGRCVTVQGISSGGLIRGDLDTVYRPTEHLDPSEAGFALGLDNNRLLKKVRPGFRQATVTGRVQDCETIRDEVHASAGPGEIVMVSGYCHYHNGAYLWVTAVRDRGAVTQPRRLVGGPQAGDLTPAPADWPWRDKVTTLAQQYLTALRSRDWKGFARLHSEDPATDAPNYPEELKAQVFDARHSAFTALRATGGTPDIAILLDREYDPEDGYRSMVCFCLTKDCKGRWPIAAFDADNRPGRPYACAELRELSWRDKAWPSFDTQVGRFDGLREPGG